MNTNLDFNQTPFLVIWEVTRACALACKHCRAQAIDQRDPRELSLAEGKKLLNDIAAMGTPIVIFTGGDPLQRDDLEELIAYGKSLRLKVGTIPAATSRLTRDRLASLGKAGIDQLALSLDATTAKTHDHLRGVEGSFDKTMQAARWVRELGLALQINTTLGAWNYEDFDGLAALVESLGIVFWEVFFLVPTGRGSELQGCTGEQYEKLFEDLYELSLRAPFVIKVTEAPHYRRYSMQHSETVNLSAISKIVNKFMANPPAHGPRMGLSPLPVNAGKGFCFVDHVGGVYPSGFLPVSAGNVRKQSVVQLYRSSPLFQDMRNPNRLKGRCGRCEYRDICGGSRSRAYAVYKDYLAEDPCCIYQPPGNG
jgi:radical SAM protein